MDHHSLCHLAARWLRNRGCTVVFVDAAGHRAAEQPDAIGWAHGRTSYLIEVKVSRSDFKRDATKPHRKEGRGMGHYRWYLAPKGLLKKEEIPPGWGLLEAKGNRVYRVSDPPSMGKLDPKKVIRELPLVISQMERFLYGRKPNLLLAMDLTVADNVDGDFVPPHNHRVAMARLLADLRRTAMPDNVDAIVSKHIAAFEALEGMPIDDALDYLPCPPGVSTENHDAAGAPSPGAKP